MSRRRTSDEPGIAVQGDFVPTAAPAPQIAVRAVWMALLATLLVPIWWGADGHYPWDVDNIAPGPVLREMATQFRSGRPMQYHPIPYYLTAVVYAPMLATARLTRELGRPSIDYPWGFQHPEVMMTALTIAGRAVSLVLGLALVMLIARWPGSADPLRSAWLVPLVVMGSPTFIYYARSSNPDLQYVVWTGLGLFLLERRRDASGRALAAASAALAVATKDQAIAMAAVLIAAATWSQLRAGGGAGGAIRAMLMPLAAALVYALAWRLPWNAAAWIGHLRDVTGPGVDPRRYSLDAAGIVGIASYYLRLAPVVAGWPALVGLVAAVVLRAPLLGFGVTAWACGAYAATMLAIGYARPRFALPLLILVIPLAARGLEGLWLRIPRGAARRAFAGLLIALAAWGGPRLSVVMCDDPRLDAERWIRRHVPENALVEIGGNPKFQARLPHTLEWIATTSESLLLQPRVPAGDIVLVSSIDRYSFEQLPEGFDSWWRGLSTYRLRAEFRSPTLAAGLTALPIAPTIWIYGREPDP